ncbi:cell division protein [Devosia limi DSM 17137]|uniref:Cell division protein n=1 Tax=Devosia limi DSM 17137 TaxID=1121477 RepID=A0A0F5LRC4_9HYPH|nr:penicillin-binding protein 2 [Devosia limi]KKB84684.1 cell division protein [Devosia limi DSM 17137]SHF54346.1 cell division protein FtsI (penicillin-binding protein 3) [Devosia limi DSM 17137]
MQTIDQTITLEGAKSVRAAMTRRRISIMAIVMTIGFVIVAARLLQLGSVETETVIEGRTISEIEASRPAILDRNGLPMAVDVRVPSLYAEPRRIIDVEEAVAALRTVLPELDEAWLRERLTGDRGFVWVKRELTPAVREQVMRLGIPGIDFLTESRRFYPGGADAAHVLGSVNIDSQGIAGIERGIDDGGIAALQAFGLARGQELQPIALSIDMRVQYAMREELVDALTRYQSLAAAGVMLDARTGEVLAMVSLPDFNPNVPASALEEGRFNRITAGNFELGSVVKIVSFAAVLDSGAVTLADSFDARFPVRFGRFAINDYRGQGRILTVPEIFRYSSNVGTIQMMQQMGKDNYRSFFSRIGFDQSIVTELPERTPPNVPKEFSDVVAATASFGHGFSVSPLHMARALAAFVNGGRLIPPTFYPRTEEEALAQSTRVISEQTSAQLQQLLRFNALVGSGSRMNRLALAYRAGGKTGTAEKVINGRYGTGKNLNVFITAFPMEAPQYVMVILLDEASPETPQSGNTAGWNAGEVSGRILARVATMLGVKPGESEAFDARVIAAMQ